MRWAFSSVGAFTLITTLTCISFLSQVLTSTSPKEFSMDNLSLAPTVYDLLMFFLFSTLLPSDAVLKNGVTRNARMVKSLNGSICFFICCFFGMLDLFDNV